VPWKQVQAAQRHEMRVAQRRYVNLESQYARMLHLFKTWEATAWAPEQTECPWLKRENILK